MGRVPRLLTLVAVGSLLAVLAPAAQAAERHVYPGQSISSAISASGPGDEVVVHAGSYPAHWITKAIDGAPVSVRPAAGEAVTVAGLTFSGARNIHVRGLELTGRLLTRSASRLRFEGVNIERAPDAESEAARFEDGTADVTFNGGRLIGGYRAVTFAGDKYNSLNWPTRVRIEDSEIARGRGDNVQVYAAREIAFVGNHIHDPQDNPDHNDGIQLIAGFGVTIDSNVFTAPTGEEGPDQAIIVGHMDPYDPLRRIHDVAIRNNLIHHWRRGASLVVSGVEGIDVANNTIYDGGASGTSASLYASSKGDPTRFANNDFRLWNNILYKAMFVNGADRPQFESHNLVQTGGGGPSLITSEPQFVDRLGYKLSAFSPAVNRALLITDTPTTDRLGRRRDALPDRGAYESGARGRCKRSRSPRRRGAGRRSTKQRHERSSSRKRSMRRPGKPRSCRQRGVARR
jgi:hypothetical protein